MPKSNCTTLNKLTLFSFLFIISILFLTSCSKENISPSSNFIDGTTINDRSTIVEIEVAKVTYQVDNGIMDIHFTASFDFTEAVLEPTQYFKFEDASGNLSTLTFQTESFDGSNGVLDATFLVGSNNLTGLTLTEAQDVIIEDIVPE